MEDFATGNTSVEGEKSNNSNNMDKRSLGTLLLPPRGSISTHGIRNDRLARRQLPQ